MTTATINLKAIAFDAGYVAATKGNVAAPALCKVYMGLIDGLAVGEGSKSLAKSWQAGYAKRVNEELEASLAD